MRRDSPARTLAWMATGAAMVAVGALVGSSTGRRQPGATSPRQAGSAADAVEDLEDRPVARAVLKESLAAVRRADALAGALASLDARVQSIETIPSSERLEPIWQRVLQLEQRIEEIRSQRPEIPSIETLASQAEGRLSPRIRAIETRVAEHQAAIQQLQTQAAQTEINLQKMIAAVERLTDQIARVLPGAAGRMEPKREAGSAAPPSAPAGLPPSEKEQQTEQEGATPLESYREREKTVPFRWKSLGSGSV